MKEVYVKFSSQLIGVMYAIYNKQKIVLNVHRSHDGINFRVIETLGSGSFLLTDYARGLEYIIEPKKRMCSLLQY